MTAGLLSCRTDLLPLSHWTCSGRWWGNSGPSHPRCSAVGGHVCWGLDCTGYMQYIVDTWHFSYTPSLCAGGSLSTALWCVPLDSLCERLCNLAQAEELNEKSVIQSLTLSRLGSSLCEHVSLHSTVITTSLQNLSLNLLKKMATSLAHNKTLKRLELRSDSLDQYKDAKLLTQHLMLGAAGSTTLTEVSIGFSSWRRDRHIQSECPPLLYGLTLLSSYIVVFASW